MENKTCGECKYFEVDVVAATCTKKFWISNDNTPACEMFEPRVVTNGDVIRHGGNRALLDYRSSHKCDVCVYAAPIDAIPACTRPDDKSCMDGMSAWLNAPAEGEEDVTDNDSQFVNDDDCCGDYAPKTQPPTNGDVIRKMSNEELVGFVDCSACIYAGHDCANQDCTEGKLAWLNASAKEGEDD